MENVLNFLNSYTVLDIKLMEICIFALVIFATLFAARFIVFFAFKVIEAQAKKTQTDLDDDLIDISKKPVRRIIYTYGFYYAFMSLTIMQTGDYAVIAKNIADTITLFIIAKLCFDIVDVFDKYINKKYEAKDGIIMHFFPLIKRTLKITIAIIALIIVVQNLGYSVTSLVAGFGITGLAVGFAAKETIANFFGSFSVVIDKAYKQGDWIAIDKEVKGSAVEGIVEDITLRSTKIRAFDNTLLIIPNNEMANASIQNVSQHERRRIYEFIDITYDTPPEKIEKAVDICRQTVLNHEGMHHDRYQIHFTKLSAHSLQIMFYVFTKTTDWGEYLAIRQELFLNIVKEFNKEGIEFAFPTQTLYLNEVENKNV